MRPTRWIATLRKPSPKRACISLLPVVGLLLSNGCASPPPPTSVLLITIDTLRADHLGVYGYRRATSPRIDALAREGVLFERAYATVPRTTQSVASLLTGLYPKNHRARGLFSVLPAGNTTLAEILKAKGYVTWAVVSNIFLQPGKGFEQGFDSYSNPRSRWDGDSSAQITDEALGRLRDAGDRPFFLWAHYLDPHWTYAPEGEFATKFDTDYRPTQAMRELQAGKTQKGDIIFHNQLSEGDRHHLVALYDGEIAQVDTQIGRLLEGIPAAQRQRLLIVLASDHGESLCEHDYCYAHGETLYDDTLRVPLIMLLPGRILPGQRFAGNVSLMDVAPTVLRLLGLGDRPGMDGIPLFSTGSGAPGLSSGREFLFAETDYQLIHSANPRFFIPGVKGRWSGVRKNLEKLIQIPRPEGALKEAFDLAADPAELNPLPVSGISQGESLSRALGIWTDYQEGAGENLEENLTPEQRERLRSLGYLQ
jgi:arylsulfatase A-like enzyme